MSDNFSVLLSMTRERFLLDKTLSNMDRQFLARHEMNCLGVISKDFGEWRFHSFDGEIYDFNGVSSIILF